MKAHSNIVEAYQGYPRLRWARVFAILCLLCLLRYGVGAVAAADAEVFVPLEHRENGWWGDAELAGRLYTFEVPQSLVTSKPLPIRTGQAFVFVRSGEDRHRPHEFLGGRQRGGCDISKNVFLDNRLWRVRVVGDGLATNAQPRLNLREVPTKLGELKLTGTFIRELRLEGADAVLLHSPPSIVQVPVGSYRQRQIAYLAGPGNPVEAYVECAQDLIVNDGKTTVFDVGGPLHNSIQADRTGRTLRLIYRLTGAGGLPVQRVGQTNSPPPTFAIYQGDRRLATGTFEYG
jgi:hypothetical protein